MKKMGTEYLGRFKGRCESKIVANVIWVKEEEQEAIKWMHFIDGIRKGILEKDNEYGWTSVCVVTRLMSP